MNRGSGLPEDAISAARLTSMRPRFMNRGSFAARMQVIIEHGNFNEAPIHESGKCVVAELEAEIQRLLQ